MGVQNCDGESWKLTWKTNVSRQKKRRRRENVLRLNDYANWRRSVGGVCGSPEHVRCAMGLGNVRCAMEMATCQHFTWSQLSRLSSLQHTAVYHVAAPHAE